MGPGKEWAPRRRAVPVLLGARAAQPAVAVGAQDVRCPLLLALGAVLQAQRSAVTDPSFSGGGGPSGRGWELGGLFPGGQSILESLWGGPQGGL